MGSTCLIVCSEIYKHLCPGLEALYVERIKKIPSQKEKKSGDIIIILCMW